MFEQLITNKYIKHLQETALPIIELDRSKDNNIYLYILDFINKSSLIISDVDLLLNKQLYWEQIHIYDVDANLTSKKLIKQLCETFGQKFVLKILDNEMQYAIEYNTKRICNINNFKLYKKYSIDKFLYPVQISVDNISILLIPPILEVIDLYKKLYNPNLADDWSDTLLIIQKLEVFVDNNFKEILLDKKNIKLLTVSDAHIHAQSDAKLSKQRNLKQPLLDFFSNSDYLILDHTITNDTLIVISRNNIEFDFMSISDYLSTYISMGVIYQKKELYIVKESSMEKYLFYITYNDGAVVKKKHILTIYNNLSYELINFVPIVKYDKNYKVVDPITELRFIYIEIFELIISQRIHTNNKINFKQKLSEKLTQLKHYKQLINITEYKPNYSGTYIDINIDKKIKALLRPILHKSSYYCYDII